ncbi:MAG TPA: peptidylprolyl isomerase, partial [Paraburkholderia sp.]
TPPPLAQVRTQIVQQIQQEKLQQFEQTLRQQAKIQ